MNIILFQVNLEILNNLISKYNILLIVFFSFFINDYDLFLFFF